MRRLEVLAVAVLGLSLAAVGRPGPARDARALPHVSTAPPAPVVKIDAAAADPEAQTVAAILSELQWRHTGLADREVVRVAEVVVEEARNRDMDPELILAVIQVESGGYNFAVSSVGALGLMQIMPQTGRELAENLGIPWRGQDTLFDPVQNVRMGAYYLHQLHDRFGSWRAALAAYNWGPARIDSRLRRGLELPSLYVQQVMRFYDRPS